MDQIDSHLKSVFEESNGEFHAFFTSIASFLRKNTDFFAADYENVLLSAFKGDEEVPANYTRVSKHLTIGGNGSQQNEKLGEITASSGNQSKVFIGETQHNEESRDMFDETEDIDFSRIAHNQDSKLDEVEDDYVPETQYDPSDGDDSSGTIILQHQMHEPVKIDTKVAHSNKSDESHADDSETDAYIQMKEIINTCLSQDLCMESQNIMANIDRSLLEMTEPFPLQREDNSSNSRSEKLEDEIVNINKKYDKRNSKSSHSQSVTPDIPDLLSNEDANSNRSRSPTPEFLCPSVPPTSKNLRKPNTVESCTKPVRDWSTESEDMFDVLTQVIPPPASDYTTNKRYEQETEDIFLASTQKVPSTRNEDDPDDLYDNPTQILDTNVIDDTDNSSNRSAKQDQPENNYEQLTQAFVVRNLTKSQKKTAMADVFDQPTQEILPTSLKTPLVISKLNSTRDQYGQSNKPTPMDVFDQPTQEILTTSFKTPLVVSKSNSTSDRFGQPNKPTPVDVFDQQTQEIPTNSLMIPNSNSTSDRFEQKNKLQPVDFFDQPTQEIPSSSLIKLSATSTPNKSRAFDLDQRLNGIIKKHKLGLIAEKSDSFYEMETQVLDLDDQASTSGIGKQLAQIDTSQENDIFDIATQQVPTEGNENKFKMPTFASQYSQQICTPEYSVAKMLSDENVENALTKKQKQRLQKHRWIFQTSSDEDEEDNDLEFDIIPVQKVAPKTETSLQEVSKSSAAKEISPNIASSAGKSEKRKSSDDTAQSSVPDSKRHRTNDKSDGGTSSKTKSRHLAVVLKKIDVEQAQKLVSVNDKKEKKTEEKKRENSSSNADKDSKKTKQTSSRSSEKRSLRDRAHQTNKSEQLTEPPNIKKHRKSEDAKEGRDSVEYSKERSVVRKSKDRHDDIDRSSKPKDKYSKSKSSHKSKDSEKLVDEIGEKIKSSSKSSSKSRSKSSIKSTHDKTAEDVNSASDLPVTRSKRTLRGTK